MKKKEKSIIEQLDTNCRTNLKGISNRVLLSKQSVYNIICNLEKRKIIKKYIAVIDKYKLGYENLYLLLKISGLSYAKQKQKEQLIKGMQGISSITNFFGDFDIGVSVYYQSIAESSSILKKVYKVFGNSIENKEIYFIKKHIIQSFVFEDNVFRKNFEKESIKKLKLKITQIESEILNRIEFNGRISYIELAKEFKRSSNTIKYHLKKLEKNEVILGYKTLLDYTALGYLWNICLLEVFPGKEITPLLNFFKVNKRVPFIAIDINNNILFDYLSEDYLSLKNYLSELKIKYKSLIKKYTLLNVNSFL